MTVKREFADEVSALATLVDARLVEMRHDPDWCMCDGTRRLTVVCARLTIGTKPNDQEFPWGRSGARRAGCIGE